MSRFLLKIKLWSLNFKFDGLEHGIAGPQVRFLPEDLYTVVAFITTSPG
jgi:hypothetical protein